MRPQITAEHPRVVAAIPFVEQLARRVAATMPHSIDIGDLVQDGVIGLIDERNGCNHTGVLCGNLRAHRT